MVNDNVPYLQRAQQIRNMIGAKVQSWIMNDAPPGHKMDHINEIPSMKALAEFSNRYRLSSILPYESYDSNTLLYSNRDTAGFVLICSPATGLTPQHLSVLNGIFNQSHPANTCIQVTMLTDTNIEPVLRRWQDSKMYCRDIDSGRIMAIMSANRVKHLSAGKWNSLFPDQPFLVKNFHLIISYSVPLAAEGEVAAEYEREALQRMREGFKSTLKSAGIISENMDPELLINILNGVLNPKQSEQPWIEWNKNEVISRQIIDADTAFLAGAGASTVVHEEKRYSLIPFHVKQFPKEWAGYKNRDLIGSFFDQTLNYPCQFIATLTVLVPDQISAKGEAKNKSMRATQMSESPIARYVPAWRERKVDWDYTSGKLDNGDKLVQAFFQVILITPEGRERQCAQDFKGLFDSIGWITTRSRFTPLHSLLGALPMGLCTESHKAMKVFGMYHTRLSWTCTNIAPWIGEWKGTRSPLLLFMGRRGQLVYFNHFDNKAGNFNIATVATSGAGKSFVTQELALSIIGTGGRVFIIDSGHSYRNLSRLLKGTYIDFGKGRPILNPFSKIFSAENIARVEELGKSNPDYSLQDYFDDFKPMLIELLGQMASPHKQLDKQAQSCLEIAISAAIEMYQGATTITRVAEMCLEQKDESGLILSHAKDLALALHPYTKNGMFRKYFEGENNLNLDNMMVVLELDDLNAKGELRNVVLQILMIQINHVMYLSGNKDMKKQVIIDEAWRFLKNERAGDFIEEGYRVARKHGGSYMTITQTINDYYEFGAAKAALSNSDFVFYLRQKGDALNEAERSGRIDNTDGKIEVLRSLKTEQGKFSEIAIQSPQGLAVVRFITDKIAEKIYSTTAEEVAFLEKSQEAGLDLFESVNSLLDRQRA